MKPQFTSAVRTTLGVLLAAAAATAMALTGRESDTRFLLPWLFIVILIALSARYGPTVSLFGSALAVIIFARRLYSPLGSLSVADENAKASLGWMALIAISASYLLFPKQNPRH